MWEYPDDFSKKIEELTEIDFLISPPGLDVSKRFFYSTNHIIIFGLEEEHLHFKFLPKMLQKYLSNFIKEFWPKTLVKFRSPYFLVIARTFGKIGVPYRIYWIYDPHVRQLIINPNSYQAVDFEKVLESVPTLTQEKLLFHLDLFR